MPNAADIVNFLGISLFGRTYVPDVDLSARTIVITGGNTGLGYDCATHLVRLGVSRLILACRDLTKGEAARQRILTELGGKESTVIEVWQVDLDDFTSVLDFCDRISTQLDRVDGLIANAGLELMKFETSEGLERTLTINVISTMLMAYATLPKLRATADEYKVQTNLTLVGSLIHAMAPVEQLLNAQKSTGIDAFASLSNPQTADMASRYPLSKLLIHLSFLGMISHLESKHYQGVTVNCVNPGWCRTSLSRAKDMGMMEKSSAVIFQRTSEQGSRTLVHGIVAGPETHGKYLSECQIKPMSSFVNSPEGKEATQNLFKDLQARLESIRRGVTQLAS